MEDPMRTITAILVLFYGNNEIQLHHEEDQSNQRESLQAYDLVAGFQADILESDAVSHLIENVGKPHEVFVYAGSLSRMLGCTTQTARNRLKELEAKGLIDKKGDIRVDIGNVNLYRPALDDPNDFFEAIDKLAGGSSAPESDNLTEVMPSDFEHLGGSEWKYVKDSTVVIDVGDVKGKTNRQHIREQLRENDLKPTSMKNFQYQLRSKAGLTN